YANQVAIQAKRLNIQSYETQKYYRLANFLWNFWKSPATASIYQWQGTFVEDANIHEQYNTAAYSAAMSTAYVSPPRAFTTTGSAITYNNLNEFSHTQPTEPMRQTAASSYSTVMSTPY